MSAYLASIIPSTFPALALAHFVALLCPGPDFILIAGHAVRHRLRGALFICVGIALGNIVYITLGILGWSAFRASTLFPALETAGACFLVWIGLRLIKSSRHAAGLHLQEAFFLSPIRQCAAGLLSALLNPKNLIFYMTLMTSVIGAEASLRQQIFCGGWMAFAVLAWDIAVAACIGMPRVQRALGRKIVLVEGASGLLLVLLGTGLLASLLWQWVV